VDEGRQVLIENGIFPGRHGHPRGLPPEFGPVSAAGIPAFVVKLQRTEKMFFLQKALLLYIPLL
jgi:hypothetical protein